MMLTHMINIDETLKLTQGQGQRSRSNIQLCEKNGLPIKHERKIGS